MWCECDICMSRCAHTPIFLLLTPPLRTVYLTFNKTLSLFSLANRKYWLWHNHNLIEDFWSCAISFEKFQLTHCDVLKRLVPILWCAHLWAYHRNLQSWCAYEFLGFDIPSISGTTYLTCAPFGLYCFHELIWLSTLSLTNQRFACSNFIP